MSADTTTWFVTGASRGFGRELTEQLLGRGHRVAATLRRPEQLGDLAARHRDRLRVRGPGRHPWRFLLACADEAGGALAGRGRDAAVGAIAYRDREPTERT